MKFRSYAVLLAVPTLLAGLLTGSPAEATAHRYVSVSTTHVAINSGGAGHVYMTCHATRTCKGTVSFEGGGVVKRYAVAAKKSAYVLVGVSSTANPAHGGTDHGDYTSKDATLVVEEDSPGNVTHTYAVDTETPVRGQIIHGTVDARAGSPVATDVNVELWKTGRGGITKFIKRDAVPGDGGSYSLAVPLGTNNAASSEYELRVTGRDEDGKFQSWFWRGSNGSPRGGGKYIIEASKVQATKFGPFDADFTYGSIKGKVTHGISPVSGVQVTVAAAPASYGNSRTSRDLDIPNCANIFGQTLTDGGGNYDIGFLPYGTVADQRYLVQADPEAVSSVNSTLALWDDKYGSCQNAMGYSRSRDSLIDISSSNGHQDFALRQSTNVINVNAGYSGFNPTTQGDLYVRIREKVSGVAVGDAPVIASHVAKKGGVWSFTNIPRGNYWVEVGRRTGCSDWYPSRYPNNNAYLNGADRGAEAWKSFTKLGSLSAAQRSRALHASPNPATTGSQGHVPSGWHGWSYRAYCGAFGAGAVATTHFTTNEAVTPVTVTPIVHKGATVAGHVSRGGGRTNKEMMVSVYSTGHTLVMRTDLTDGGGNFSVKGLASGTYHIEVNSDSWRGISRAFTGRHTIHVTAGHTYHVGTLHFQNEADKADFG